MICLHASEALEHEINAEDCTKCIDHGMQISEAQREVAPLKWRYIYSRYAIFQFPAPFIE